MSSGVFFGGSGEGLIHNSSFIGGGSYGGGGGGFGFSAGQAYGSYTVPSEGGSSGGGFGTRMY